MFSPELKKGGKELLVLSLLDECDRHGYDIGKLIEERSAGRLVFQISSLYPTLSRLENRGWISGRWVEKAGERRRRFYRLTKKGRAGLRETTANWHEYISAMQQVLEPSHA